jgi:hypothetical protein
MTRRTWARALVAVAVLALPFSPVASAAGDTVSFDPLAGGPQDYTTLTTSGPCPAASSHLEVLVTGGTSEPMRDARAVGVTSLSAFSRSGQGGLVVPLTLSMRELAESVGAPDVGGSYRYVVRCRTGDDPTPLQDFTGTLMWGGGTTEAFSATYRVAQPGPPAWRPVLGGTVRAGGRASCVADFDGAATIRFGWLLDDVALTNAADRSLPLRESWVGHRLACVVTAAGVDGSSTGGTSAPVKVAVGPPLRPSSPPSLVGTARVGRRLSIRPPSWTPQATRLTYQWRRDRRSVAGRTGSTYLLSSADAGHQVSAVVVAARPGWTNGTATTRSVLVIR